MRKFLGIQPQKHLIHNTIYTKRATEVIYIRCYFYCRVGSDWLIMNSLCQKMERIEHDKGDTLHDQWEGHALNACKLQEWTLETELHNCDKLEVEKSLM